MPNKDMNRTPTVESKTVASPVQHAAANKTTASTAKAVVSKSVKDPTMSPGAPPSVDAERTELLGSLTTLQQQRTSARVIKKLRLEPQGDRDKRGIKKDGTDDIPECETPNKIDEKDLKFPTVKQRMPKALWSTDEKNLFFEALNEYGKDFDAITAYICAKMKKKGMPDNLKTKTQVSHFYYRTWHKLSKHVHFDENVKKVAQELYALINYGELRKKLVSVSEKTCARLGELVLCGSLVVRARGRNMRVRTPMCRALRRLNQITEVALGARVCGRAQVLLRARCAGAWARVQSAAHNPRAALALPLRARLAALLRALAQRWRPHYKHGKLADDTKYFDDLPKEPEDCAEVNPQICEEKEINRDLEDHINLETDRIILQEQAAAKPLALHVGPRPGAQIHLPVVSPSEQLSSQKICFSSYLERMGSQRDKDGTGKIRTPKRTRKDSATEKEKDVEQKKMKMEDSEKLINIEETAIDGIELMAHYKSHQEDDEKPSTEDEKERETTEEDGDRYLAERDKDISERDKDLAERDKEMSERDKDLSERDKDMSEREKDSFSEMEDDEKYNKSDSDNESDHGKDKSGKENKFKNLKVKFRIRPKKRGGTIYTLVMDNPEDVKVEEPKMEEPVKVEEEAKPDIDVELALKQIRKGWSVYDAGDLTIGDLYLMFGSRSKLELDYWWAEPTPPLPQPQKSTTIPDKEKICDKKEKIDKISEKSDKVPEKLSEKPSDKLSDKGADSSVEDDKEKARESDNDILSPKNTYSQDSNDGMSGDERKSSEQLASPDHKSSSSTSSTFKLVNKLINRPQGPPPPNGFSLLSDRLKRLLALAGNPHASASLARCACGHACAQPRRQLPAPPVNMQQQRQQPYPQTTYRLEETNSSVFRHPTPIAPRPDNEVSKTEMMLDGIRWRRGRPRSAGDRRVVVQRLLPLLPKLPAPNNPVPLKLVSNSTPAPPRILPKPPPTSTSDLSFFYVLSESNGQFYFHDGDRRIPISPLSGNGEQHTADSSNTVEMKANGVKTEELTSTVDTDTKETKQETDADTEPKTERADVTSADVIPSKCTSPSPSRLLHDDSWLEGSVQDFSLSSFLGDLQGTAQPDPAKQQPYSPTLSLEDSSSAVFRHHPTPIAPRPDGKVSSTETLLEGIPRWRRGRPRSAGDRRVVVQRLLPLLPKLPAPTHPVPGKQVQNSPPVPLRILPKPPSTSTSDLSFFYVLSESNGQFYFHDGDRRIPISPLSGNGEQHTADSSNVTEMKTNGVKTEELTSTVDTDGKETKQETDADTEPKVERADVTPADFLPTESMSLSPSRLLHDAEGWFEGSVQDFSLSSFLGHLEGRPQPDLAVDSQLQSLMAESSVDYVAKFADLAAEVTDEPDLKGEDLT